MDIAEKAKDNSIKDLEIEIKQNDYEIDDKFEYPSYGQEKIQSLVEQINNLKQDELINNDINIIKLTEPLFKVKSNIDIERKQLNKRQE